MMQMSEVTARKAGYKVQGKSEASLIRREKDVRVKVCLAALALFAIAILFTKAPVYADDRDAGKDGPKGSTAATTVTLIYEDEELEVSTDIVTETPGILSYDEANGAFADRDEREKPRSEDAYKRSVMYMRDTEIEFSVFPENGISVDDEEVITIWYQYKPYDYDVLVDLGGGTYPYPDPLVFSLYDREVTIAGKKYYQGMYDIKSHATVNGIKSYYDEESEEYMYFPASLVRPTAPRGYIFTGWKVDYYDGGFTKDAKGNITGIPARTSDPWAFAARRATELADGAPEHLGREYIPSRSQQPVYGHCVVTAKYTNEGFVVAVPRGDEILGEDYRVPGSYFSSARMGYTFGFLAGTKKLIVKLDNEDEVRGFTKKSSARYDLDKYDYYAMDKTSLFQFVLYTCQGFVAGKDAVLINGKAISALSSSFGNAGGKMYSFNNNANLEIRKSENQKLVDNGTDGVIVIDVNKESIDPVATNVKPVVYSDDGLKVPDKAVPGKHDYKITFYRNGKRKAISKKAGSDYDTVRDVYYWGDDVSVKIEEVTSGKTVNDKIKVYYLDGKYKKNEVGSYASYDECYNYLGGNDYIEVKPDENGRYSFRVKPPVTKNSSTAQWANFWIIDKDYDPEEDPPDDPDDPKDDKDDKDDKNKPKNDKEEDDNQNRPGVPDNGGNGDGTGNGDDIGNGSGSDRGSGDGSRPGGGTGAGDRSGTAGTENGIGSGDNSGGTAQPDETVPVIDPSKTDVSPVVSPSVITSDQRDPNSIAREKSDLTRRKHNINEPVPDKVASSESNNRFSPDPGRGAGGSQGKKLDKALKKALKAYEIAEDAVKNDPNFIPLLIMISVFVLVGMIYERNKESHELNGI